MKIEELDEFGKELKKIEDEMAELNLQQEKIRNKRFELLTKYGIVNTIEYFYGAFLHRADPLSSDWFIFKKEDIMQVFPKKHLNKFLKLIRFARDNIYWMYENQNKPLYGDELKRL